MATESGKEILVTNAEELIAALNDASGGEQIILAPGEYGDLDISPRTLSDSEGVFSSEVTIRSQDPDDPAVFNKVSVSGAQNVTFDSVRFEFNPGEGDTTSTSLVTVRGWNPAEREAENIKIVDSTFEGTPVPDEFGGDPLDHLDVAAHGNNVAGMSTGIALRVDDASGFTLEGTEITGFFRAATFRNSEDIVVSGNDIHDQRSDGLNFAAVSNVLIEDNDIRDVTPWRHDDAVGKGDHGDLIQFWTTNTTTPNTDIVIRNNLLHVSDGDASQSIFMRNEEVDRGNAGEEMYYQNVLIENNVIYNAHVHGTTVGEGFNIQILNNTYIQNVEEGSEEAVTIPAITVASASQDVVIANNIVPKINNTDMDGTNGWSISNNLITQSTDESADNYVGNLFVDALSGQFSSLADLQARMDGIIAEMGVGAESTQFNTHPDELTPTVLKTAGTFSGNDQLFIFDGSLTANSDGLVSDATFHWDFGDGTTAEGRTVTHEYDGHGDYQVTLTVTLPDGTSATNTAIASISDPVLVYLEMSEEGIIDASSYGTEITHTSENSQLEVLEDGSVAYRLVDSSALAIDRTASHLFNHDQFRIDFDFHPDAAQGNGGFLLYWLNSMYLELSDDGALEFTFLNADGEEFTITTDAVITSADWHKVSITYDATTGAAKIWVNDEVVAEAEMSGLTAPQESWGLQIGNGNKDNADGLISNFAMYGTTEVPESVASSEKKSEDVDVVVQPSEFELAKAQAYSSTTEEELAAADRIIGTSDNDTLFSGAEDDTVNGGAGDDFIAGENGNDRITGDAGIDTLYGGLGDDRITGEYSYGGAGNDTIVAGEGYGGAGDDILKAGAGDFTGTIRLDGGFGDDTVSGGNEADILIGGDGHDVLRGNGGHDTMSGGDGNDYISGNVVDGGAGNDTIRADNDGDTGEYVLDGGSGNDIVNGSNAAELIIGGVGNDTLKGGAGNDTLVGDLEDTYFHGGSGHDVLQMSEGSDAFHVSDRFLVHIEELDFENDEEDNIFITASSDILQSGGNELTITGDEGDTLTLGLDLQNTGTVTDERGTFDVYTDGALTLMVDTDIDMLF